MEPWRALLMIRSWTCALCATRREVMVRVRSPETGDVLKARLPLPPSHPRALLTMLEGVALYQGHRLCVALSAAPSLDPLHVCGLLGDELWPASSPLVRFCAVDRGPH